MKILDIILRVKKYFVEYARMMLITLIHPIKSFGPKKIDLTNIEDISVNGYNISDINNGGFYLPKWAFVLTSIFLGLILNLFVPPGIYFSTIIAILPKLLRLNTPNVGNLNCLKGLNKQIRCAGCSTKIFMNIQR